MSRLSLPSHHSAPERSKAVLEMVQHALGTVPNMFRLVANSPDALSGFAMFDAALANTLDVGTRERIALAVARINGSSYCLAAHGYLAATLAALSPEEIALNLEGGSSDPKADAAVRFAAKVTEQRGHVGDVDLVAVRQAGYSDAEIVDIVALVAASCFTNYLNAVAATEIDYPFARALH